MAFTDVTPRDAEIVQFGGPLSDDLLHGLFPGTGSPGAVIGLACALVALVLIVVDFSFGRLQRSVLRLVALGLFAGAAWGLMDRLFDAVDAIEDLPVVTMKWAAQKRAEPFADPNQAYPLRLRYTSDFSTRISDVPLRQRMRTASDRCLTDHVFENISDGLPPDPELKKLTVKTIGGYETCYDYLTTLNRDFDRWSQNAGSRFAARRAAGRVAWAELRPGEPLPDPASERSTQAWLRDVLLIFHPVDSFGVAYGWVSVGGMIVNRFLFLFLFFPQYWKFLVGYIVGMFWIRAWVVGLYAGHAASKHLTQFLATLDTDADMTFLHAVAVHYIGAVSSDGRYASWFTSGLALELIVPCLVSLALAVPLALGVVLLARSSSNA